MHHTSRSWKPQTKPLGLEMPQQKQIAKKQNSHTREKQKTLISMRKKQNPFEYQKRKSFHRANQSDIPQKYPSKPR